MTRCLCIGVFLLSLLTALLPVDDCRAEPDSSAVIDLAERAELVVGVGASRLWLPVYGGADTVWQGTTVGKTDTRYSGSVDCNTYSIGLNLDTPFSLFDFDDIRLVSSLRYSDGHERSTGLTNTSAGQYILALSIDPDYTWVQAVGTNGVNTYDTSVRIDAADTDFALGFEGEGAMVALSDDVSLTPVAYTGMLVQHQRTRYQTDIVRRGTGEYDSVDEKLTATQFGPEFRAGMRLALPGEWNMTLMANAAALLGLSHLSGKQDTYTTYLPAAFGRPASPHVEHEVWDTYGTFLLGANLEMEKRLSDSLVLDAAFHATYWTARPGIQNPTYINYNPAGVDGPNEGMQIIYDHAQEVGLKINLTYAF